MDWHEKRYDQSIARVGRAFLTTASRVQSPPYSAAEFGSRLALVTMTIEVAPGGHWRVCFRPRQTEKERGVTVINVLAETETANSPGPVVTDSVKKHEPLA